MEAEHHPLEDLAPGKQTLETRLDQLALRLETLTQRVDQLALQVEAAAKARPAAPKERYAAGEGDASEELLSWVGKSSLLQRLSTLCFLLVVALILRTVTDSGLVDLQIGSLIGMGYAALLMIMGWRRYQRHNVLAPIFTIASSTRATVDHFEVVER